MTETILIDWTIWCSMLCFGSRLLLWIRRRGVGRSSTVEWWLWTSGCLLLLIHILAAFHFRHGWSHAHAIRETAAQTKARTGIDWGGGVWINYLMLAWWMGDVVRMRVIERPGQRRSHWDIVTLSFFSFVVFNATVVFGSEWWIAVFLGWAVAALVAWNVPSSNR